MDVCGNCGRTRKQETAFCTGCGRRFVDDNPQSAGADNPFRPPDLPGPLISPDPPDRTHPRDPIRLPRRTFPRNRRGLRNPRGLRILAGSPGPGHPQEATDPLRPGAPSLPLDLLIAPGAPGPGSSAWRSSLPSSRRWWSSSLRPAALCSICGITRRMPKRRGTRSSRRGRHRPRKMPHAAGQDASAPAQGSSDTSPDSSGAVGGNCRGGRVPGRGRLIGRGLPRPVLRRINARDYQSYFSMLSPQVQQGMTQAQFENGYRSTADSNETLVGISAASDGDLAAEVTFTSHQNPADSPDQSESCTDWDITLFLTQSGSGYVIDPAPSDYHASYQPCRDPKRLHGGP